MAVNLYESHRPRETTITVSQGDPTQNQDYSGDFVCSGAADDVDINAALAYVNALGGGEVRLLDGTYTLAAPIIVPGNSIAFSGLGRVTFIDGDALATNEHAIEINGFTDCAVRNLSIQTNDGGGLNCDCIFIEDGADRFAVIDVTILNSDRYGIRLEGTSIVKGLISGCTILDSDDEHISSAPDVANNITYITVSNCYMATGGGNWVGAIYGQARSDSWNVVDNIIYHCDTGIVVEGSEWNINGNIVLSSFTSYGISIWAGNYHNIVGNIVDSCTENNINVESDYCNVTGNVTTRSTGDGIAVTGNDCTVSGNFVSHNVLDGIFTNGDRVLISGNNCTLNDSGDTGSYHGINLSSADHVTVTGNICSLNHGLGIKTLTVNRSTFTGNIAMQNDLAGMNCGGADFVVDGNIFYDNGQEAAATYHELEVSAPRCIISNNHLSSPGDSSENCIHLIAAGDNCMITGNFCYNGMGSGIVLVGGCVNNLISGNYLMNNDDYGIDIAASTCIDNSINGNFVIGNGSHGIWDEGDRNSFIGNHITNNGSSGFYIEKTDRSIILGNYIYRNSAAGGTAEINLHGGTVTHCKIIGNYIDGGNRSSDCLIGYFIEDLLVLSNYIADSTDGIDFNSSVDRAYIQGNHFYSTTTAIRIVNANCDDNVVLWNTYEANGTCLSDNGTGTILASYSMPFIQGTTFISAADNPWGWEIDAGGEFALAVGKIPWFVSQVLRIKVVAVGLAAPGVGNNMRLQLTGEGATFDEVYTTEPIDVAAKNNNEEAFAVDDVISWTFTATDDADIGHLLGNDRLQIKVLHDVAGNGDIATDATFSSVEVEYV